MKNIQEEKSILAQIVDATKQQHTGNPNGKPGGITTVTISRDGEYIYTTGEFNAKRWQAKTGQALTTYVGHTDSTWCLALPVVRNRIILTGARDALVKRWNKYTGECEMDYEGHEGEDPGVRCMTLLPSQNNDQETTFFTGSRDFTVRQWDIDSGECTRVLQHSAIVWNICASPDGKFVFSSTADNFAIQWDAQTKSTVPVQKFEHPDFVWTVAVSPDNSSLYTGCRDHKARHWNIKSGEIVREFTGHTDSVRWLALNHDGSRLLTCGYDVKVKEWDTQSGRCLQDISAHQKAVLCVTAHPNGDIFSSGTDELGVLRFSPAPKSNPGDAPDAPPVLTESPLVAYNNITYTRMGLLILAIIVQALQIASFAFSLGFPWHESVLWLQEFLSGFALSISYLLDKLPEFSFSSFNIGLLVWAYIVILLFFTDSYAWLQLAKSKLNQSGFGKVKWSRYKGDNPLERGDRSPTNLAVWEAWEKATLIYRFVAILALFVDNFLWISTTFLGIPIIGALVQTAVLDEKIVGYTIVGLILFIITFLRMRLVDGSAAKHSLAIKYHFAESQNRNNCYIPFSWVISLSGIATIDANGPFTIVDWRADFGAAVTYLAFTIINNTNEISIAVLAAVNMSFGILLVLNLVKFEAYSSFKVNKTMFGLQGLQMWNAIIAFAVVGVNDSDNFTPAIVWYIGFLPIYIGASFLYTVLKKPKISEKGGSSTKIMVTSAVV